MIRENIFKIDDCMTRLSCLSDTFVALDVAAQEGGTHLPDCALAEPVSALRELSKQLTSLMQVVVKELRDGDFND